MISGDFEVSKNAYYAEKCKINLHMSFFLCTFAPESEKKHTMPEVSRFYGIVIKMFFKPKEHEPAHIHALYEEYMGIFDITTYEMTEGDLPNRAQKMVREWLMAHTDDLQKMWDTQKIVKLPPLAD